MSAALVVFNAGSSSLKVSLFRLDPESDHPQPLATGLVSDLDGSQPRFAAQRTDGSDGLQRTLPPVRDDGGYRALIADVFGWAAHLGGTAPVAAVGHRIVHGGGRFVEPIIIDGKALAELEKLIPLAPLHMPHDLQPVRALGALHPGLTQIGCFDTAFHCTLPAVETRLGLPRALTDGTGLRRYGFHGLSYEYIAGELHRLDPQAAAGRVVIAHLGSGASLCAMVNGRSVATTMGFSALDGLLMATRCGSLDPGALLHLLRQPGADPAAIEHLLYHESGLLGVSGGISSDLRQLLADSRPAAREAVASFIYRIRRELGAMVAAAGGIDALVFTGGIGEHAGTVRAAVADDAAWLGLRLDMAANAQGHGRIDGHGSRVRAWVIPTDENAMISRHCARILRRQAGARAPLQAALQADPGGLPAAPQSRTNPTS
jgi:acetate kinase